MKSTPQEIAARVLARVSDVDTRDTVRWAGVSEEEWDRISEIIDSHNARIGFNPDKARLVLDVTGKYSEYFTLWKFIPVAINGKPYNFIKNVSKSLEKAVTETLAEHPNSYLVIADVEVLAWDPQVLKFGKYRKCNIHDVFEKDPKYIVWLANQIRYGERPTSKPVGSALQEKMILALADAWREELSKENEQTVESAFIIDDVKDLKITVDYIDVTPVAFGHGYAVRYQDMVFIKGHAGKYFVQFRSSGKATSVLKTLKKGDDVVIKSAHIKNNVTKLGIKWTILARVTV